MDPEVAPMSSNVFDGITRRHETLHKELKSLHVAEWGTTVYYHEKPSTADAIEILKYLKPDGMLDLEAVVTAVMVRCLNEDGSRMFLKQHKDILLHKTEFDVLAWIVAEQQTFELITGGSLEITGKR